MKEIFAKHKSSGADSAESLGDQMRSAMWNLRSSINARHILDDGWVPSRCAHHHQFAAVGAGGGGAVGERELEGGILSSMPAAYLKQLSETEAEERAASSASKIDIEIMALLTPFINEWVTHQISQRMDVWVGAGQEK